MLDTPFGKFARLQILTIEDLFADKKPAMPPQDPAAFRRAALPRLAVQAAELPALGRVDLVQAYPLAVYLNGIAVDHRGRAGYVGQGAEGLFLGVSS